ncbi:MAG: DNA helicase RecQ [bacterium]
MIEKAEEILMGTFGYSTFRPLQREVIQHVLAKKDTLVIMPTGGGKSLCYQIPALIFEGLTIVVSPLISLMKDQVEQLQEFGVEAVFLNSTLTAQMYNINARRVQRGRVKLLYAAPEALFSDRILSLLSPLKVDCICVDEAHCISEWGHDFRPEYRQLVNLRSIFPETVYLALTATATPRVQKDIQDNLRYLNSKKFIGSFNRENLFIQVMPKNSPLLQLLRFLENYNNQSGIVYCFSRKQVDSLAHELETRGFSVKPYHAGLEDKSRRKNQELFIKDDVQIIVATIAFGMGINKPNVRFVVHYDLPKSIETYYQEIGRAGRDGLRAHCLLLFGYGDIKKIKYFIDQKEDPEKRVANLHLSAMLGFAETEMCRRLPILHYFGEAYDEDDCGMCDNCVEGKKKQTDVTIPAQMFLSCVARTGERFGASHIINVLHGSMAQKVLKFGHQMLSTHSIGKEYSQKQWFHFSRQFLQKGLISQEMEYGGLRLTPKARQVLRGDLKVMGRIEEEKEVAVKSGYMEEEYDIALFEKLRMKRKELADASGIPPYAVFPDKTLIEMSSRRPENRAELLDIHGVGQVKLNKYGNIFLGIIRSHSGSRHKKMII